MFLLVAETKHSEGGKTAVANRDKNTTRTALGMVGHTSTTALNLSRHCVEELRVRKQMCKSEHLTHFISLVSSQRGVQPSRSLSRELTGCEWATCWRPSCYATGVKPDECKHPGVKKNKGRSDKGTRFTNCCCWGPDAEIQKGKRLCCKQHFNLSMPQASCTL